MRRVRLQYDGSYHHVMNRGIQGEKIFFDKRARAYFLEIMVNTAMDFKMKLIGYCIMNNHYHLVIQNTSGRLSEYMKRLNGNYGIYYRKRRGGRGYVFQSRFKSILIQNDRYLRMVLLYVLLNPVRAGKVDSPYEYLWSSIHEYFSSRSSCSVANMFVEKIFETEGVLHQELKIWCGKELPIVKTRFGDILGDHDYVKTAIKVFDRRGQTAGISLRMRCEETYLKSYEQVVNAFELEHGIALNDLDCTNRVGKALRAKLLVSLKDEAGMTYAQIVCLPTFQTLKYSSLGQIYKRARARMKKVT